MLDVLIYGPQVTFEGAFSLTLPEILALPLVPATTALFIGRTMIDGFAMILPFLIIGIVGGGGNPKRKKKRFSDSSESEMLRGLRMSSVRDAIEDGMSRLLAGLEGS